MAINKNHEFEEVAGVKCAIVEKNASKERVAFLKELLEHNRFTVVTAPSPPPKAKAGAVAVAVPEGTEPVVPVEEPAIESFTIGVTDMMFNPINAVFGRLLRTKEERVVTLAYWEQRRDATVELVPYYENRG